MELTRLEQLLANYLAETISTEELLELQQLVQIPANEPVLDQVLARAYANQAMAIDTDYDKDEIFAELMARAKENQALVITMESKANWKRWLVAASIIVLLGLTAFFLVNQRRTDPDPQTNIARVHDVEAPKTVRATITLANGEQVYLDSVGSGQLAMQGNVKLMKLEDGRIVYTSDASTSGNVETYNTLVNPRGSKVIDMVLSDGSHVWLNAGSSLRYPVAFMGKERKVEITGEAYFEVSHDATRPFYVTKNEMHVQVLGTQFNVNAYDDEENIKVTLVEGSVHVTSNPSSLRGANTPQAQKNSSATRQSPGITLTPGQQAIIDFNATNNLNVSNNVDLDAVMAWKNGLFSFHRADIKTVMRQLSRWYDIEVKYEGEITTEQFGGKVQRNLNLSEVLEILKTTGVQFTLEGRVLTVK
jgi:transmembrane sensor